MAELRARLSARGYEDRVVEGVLERLREAGLQDDGRFAAQYASDAAARGLSARRIQGELLVRGVGPELAAASSAERPEAEERRARAAATKRAAGMGSLTPEVRYRRLAGFLARRGYENEVCRRVAAEVAGFHFS